MVRQLPRYAGRSAFGTDPEGYDLARSDYPAELYDLIAEVAGAGTVLEIGAGTGLATRSLLALRPDRLVAVEPDLALAAFLQNRFGQSIEVFAHAFGEEDIIGKFDLVACASAFHWLEPEPALQKIRGLLHPGGKLALWWNVYRQPNSDDAFTDAIAPLLEDIVLAPSETQQGHYGLNEDLHRSQLTAAGFGEIEYHRFERLRFIDGSAARALFASYSFVKSLPQAQRRRLLTQVAQLVDGKYGGKCANRIVTPCYLATSY